MAFDDYIPGCQLGPRVMGDLSPLHMAPILWHQPGHIFMMVAKAKQDTLEP